VAGRRTVPRPENNLTLEEMLERYARAGVEQVLAIHAFAREYSPLIGNDHISVLCVDHPTLKACYVVMPHWTGEMPEGDALIEYLRDGGARAVRLFPRDHSYGLGSRWCGPLFSTLEEAGVPVLMDMEQTGWPEVDAILTRHPALNLTLLRVGYRIDRWVYPLLEAHAGLRLETALYAGHTAVEELVSRFGPDRLIFGTGMPVWDIGAAMTPILYAEVSEEARRAIAGETLRSILWNGGVS
jgi:predicted TIM-barrel fold metal-dependent hydrolase